MIFRILIAVVLLSGCNPNTADCPTKIIHDTIYSLKPAVVGKSYGVFDEMPDIKPGQIWEYSYPDPFDPHSDEFTVIAVKNNYIQYQSKKTGHIHSDNWYLFSAGSKLKK